MKDGTPVVVAFTKDWDDVPTCTTHVLREMARSMPVLWIESIGTRKPSMAATGDLRRLLRRIGRALAGAVVRENELRVLSPLVLPKTESRIGRRVNRRLFAWQLGRELRRVGPSPIEWWCFVPNAVDLIPGVRSQESGVRGETEAGASQHARIVYYCVDDWSEFHNLDGEWLSREEERLLRIADVVFTPARYLEAKCRRLAGDKVHYVPHGVDYAIFARALDAGTPVPADVADLPRPIVGFYGNIHPWVDLELIEYLARARPAWSFVLIGEVFCDVSRLRDLPNMHLLGRREHEALPSYCKAFDAAIIPYDIRQARMESVNPVKTKELLAAGLPIVAADVPELRGYGEDVIICRTLEEWIAALERQMGRTDRREISARMARHDWSARVAEIRRIVEGTAKGPERGMANSQ